MRSLLEYKQWADSELCDALQMIAQDQYPEQFHTGVRLMNHIHVVDCIFQAHLKGETHSFSATNTVETPQLSDLKKAMLDVDDWYVHYSQSLDASQLAETVHFQFTDGDMGAMTREEILMHIVIHSAYHRGNIGQILKSIDIAPPRDIYTKFLHVSDPSRRV